MASLGDEGCVQGVKIVELKVLVTASYYCVFWISLSEMFFSQRVEKEFNSEWNFLNSRLQETSNDIVWLPSPLLLMEKGGVEI